MRDDGKCKNKREMREGIGIQIKTEPAKQEGGGVY